MSPLGDACGPFPVVKGCGVQQAGVALALRACKTSTGSHVDGYDVPKLSNLGNAGFSEQTLKSVHSRPRLRGLTGCLVVVVRLSDAMSSV